MAGSSHPPVPSPGVTAVQEPVDGRPGYEEPRPRRRRRWLAAVVVSVIATFVISAAVVELPYYAFRPGSVRDSGAAVSVEGTTTYAPDGSISYTTVSLRPTTLFGLLGAWIDDDVDVVARDRVLGDRNPDQNRQLNLELMDDSQQTATLVALETLGYDVQVSIAGQVVVDVQTGMPADGVLDPGDTIVEIDGEPVDDLDDLERLMSDKVPGDEVDLVIMPLDEPADRREVTITLAAGPDDADRGVMGVFVQPADVDFDFPVDVSFDTGEVGGPSAGLAFTLTLIDLLSPGELTGGEEIAVTGAIDADGRVLPVGGAAQKAAAVRDADIDAFLVPVEDYQDALRSARDVEVIQVASVDEALRELDELGGESLETPLPGVNEAAAAA